MIPDPEVIARGEQLERERAEANARGVPLLPKRKPKYIHDYWFFYEPNPTNSYFGGLLAADGNVREDYGRVRLCLHESDRGLIESLIMHSKFTGEPKPINGTEHLELCVYGCYQWAADLRRHFSVMPQKTETIQPPVGLNHACTLSFIVGYLDANGSLGYHCDGYFRIGVSGGRFILEWIKSVFDTLVPPHNRESNVRGFKHANSFEYKVAGARGQEVYKVLKAHPVPYRLARKWQYEF